MKKILLIALCATSMMLNAQTTSQDTTATFDCGELVTIEAQPNTGYHFVQWSDGVTQAQRQIDLKKDTLLTAIFAHNDLKISFSATEGGTVVDSLKREGAFDADVPWGESVVATAKVMDDCYEFVGWYYAGTEELYSEEVTITVEPTADMQLVATFKVKKLSIQLTPSDSTMGKVVILSKNE